MSKRYFIGLFCLKYYVTANNIEGYIKDPLLLINDNGKIKSITEVTSDENKICMNNHHM